MARRRRARALVLGISACLAASGCLYPDYTFDETAGAGGAGGSASTTATTGTAATTTGTAATTTGTMATTTATSGTMATTTSTSSSGSEDCVNGADDDGDTLIDCADSDCDAGFSCVDAIPVGWGLYGYVALSQSVPGNEPACPGEFPDPAFQLGGTLIAPPATCTACSCGAPVGDDCTLPDLETVDPLFAGIDGVMVGNKSCGMVSTYTGFQEIPANWDGSCAGIKAYAGGQRGMICGGTPCNSSVTSGAPIVTGGVCAPSGGSVTKPPVSWAVSALGCGGASTGGGCAAGACLPKPVSGFESNVCIAKTGESACPGPFTVGFTFHDPAQTVDDRSCTTCQCDPSAGGTCAGTISVYSNPSIGVCSNVIATFPAGGCANLAGNPTFANVKMSIDQAPSGSNCAVSVGGGAATGAVTAAGPTTVCCLP